MNDPRQFELINAAIDGELDAAGQAELEEVLKSSESARANHEELQHLVAFIETSAKVEPPRDLRERIISAIELPAPKRKWLGIFDMWTNFGRAASRPAQLTLAAAAGALVTAGAYTFSGSMPGSLPVEQLVGTMAKNDLVAVAPGSRQLPIQTGVVSGVATMEAVGSDWVIGFDLEPRQPVAIDVQVSGDEKKPLRFGIEGRSRVWAAVATDSTASPPAVTFNILADGEIIYSGAFDAPQ